MTQLLVELIKIKKINQTYSSPGEFHCWLVYLARNRWLAFLALKFGHRIAAKFFQMLTDLGCNFSPLAVIHSPAWQHRGSSTAARITARKSKNLFSVIISTIDRKKWHSKSSSSPSPSSSTSQWNENKTFLKHKSELLKIRDLMQTRLLPLSIDADEIRTWRRCQADKRSFSTQYDLVLLCNTKYGRGICKAPIQLLLTAARF